MPKKKKKNRAWVATGIVLIVGVFLLNRPTEQGGVVPSVSAHEMTVYKSPTCGCCANYVAYMKRAGYNIKAEDVADMDAIKKKYGIPRQMESCHTTVINGGEYVVEGHIPYEGIETLLADDSPVHTIMLPDMPVGSPGMPGKKRGAFNIHSIDADGVVSEYIKL